MSGVGLYSPEQVKLESAHFAKQFAEGSQCLEQLLNNLYQADISTVACCPGHEPDSDGLVFRAYVAIIVDEKSLPYIHRLVNQTKQQEYYKYILSTNVKTNQPIFTIYAPALAPQYADELFQQMDQELNSQLEQPVNVENETVNAGLTFIDNFFPLDPSGDVMAISINRMGYDISLEISGTFQKHHHYADAFDVPYTNGDLPALPQFEHTYSSIEEVNQKITDFNNYILSSNVVAAGAAR